MKRTIVLAANLAACSGGTTGGGPSPSAETSSDALTEYRRKSIASEAKVHLARMADAVHAAFEEERSIGGVGALPASAPMTPEAGVCCKQPSGKCGFGFAKWDHATWRKLMFEIENPHYYSYELETTPDGFVARAVGDLDCDGTLSTFELRGSVKAGALELEPIATKDPLE